MLHAYEHLVEAEIEGHNLFVHQVNQQVCETHQIVFARNLLEIELSGCGEAHISIELFDLVALTAVIAVRIDKLIAEVKVYKGELRAIELDIVRLEVIVCPPCRMNSL
jgi:hypothetical protein